MDPIHPHDPGSDSLEGQIGSWRAHLSRSRAITDADAAELEDHLREQVEILIEQGLSPDEAFLVAVRRMGAVDELTREYAREHSDRLWKQLVLAGEPGTGEGPLGGLPETRRMWAALTLAVAAAVATRIPGLFGIPFDPDRSLFYPLNISFFTLPFLVAWFAWERPLPTRTLLGIAAAFAVAATAVNTLWLTSGSPPGEATDALALTLIHLPITLWFLVGVAYVGGRWRGNERRMDFLRFTGETFIYYVLIALGGGVLIGLTFALFEAIAIDVEQLIANWVLPSGIVGATVIATWLVEAKQGVIENMAPVLARIFIPLVTLVLLAFVVTMAVTGRGIDVEREILIAVDLLLVVVFGLLLYSISARDPGAPVGLLDRVQVTLVGSALLVDLLALGAIGSRISEFGFTPNRLAALGMNLVLLANLAGSAYLYLRFLGGRGPFERIWAWQMSWLYVIAGWAAVVAFLFPLIFRGG